MINYKMIEKPVIFIITAVKILILKIRLLILSFFKKQFKGKIQEEISGKSVSETLKNFRKDFWETCIAQENRKDIHEDNRLYRNYVDLRSEIQQRTLNEKIIAFNRSDIENWRNFLPVLANTDNSQDYKLENNLAGLLASSEKEHKISDIQIYAGRAFALTILKYIYVVLAKGSSESENGLANSQNSVNLDDRILALLEKDINTRVIAITIISYFINDKNIPDKLKEYSISAQYINATKQEISLSKREDIFEKVALRILDESL